MRASNRGFTFLGLMFLIALMGIMAAAAGTAWTFSVQRDKELDLLFVGREYRVALTRYAAAHARQGQPFPRDLRQLLGEEGSLAPVRYLRRLYPDPMTGNAAWGLVKTPGGGITGVYSLSVQRPIRRQVLAAGEAIDFDKALTYRDWVFRAGAAAGPGLAPGDAGDGSGTENGPPAPTWGNPPPAPPTGPVERD